MSAEGNEVEQRPTLSIVIPVFNSEKIVATTVAQTIGAMRDLGRSFEILLVNDGSSDGSWDVVRSLATDHDEVVGIDLLRNYGQHPAIMCGLRAARGDWVVTIDDDLQNPPTEITPLLEAGEAGHDVVFGQFVRKQAGRTRSLGSRAISMVNRRIFGQPRSLTVSNYRLLRRDVVDRMTADRSVFPYITGLSLLYSNRPANVTVRHDPRPVGKSTYTTVRIMRLVLTILFSYSAAPLRWSAGFGFVVAFGSFALGTTYFVIAIARGFGVDGFATIVVLLSFFNGIIVLLLSMIGEYVVRTMQQTKPRDPYQVVAVER